MVKLDLKQKKYLHSKKQLWSRVILHQEKRSRKLETRKNCWEETVELWKQNSDVYWDIEDILDQRFTEEGRHEVLIKWKNWPSKFNTWEPIEHLGDELSNILESIRQRKSSENEYKSGKWRKKRKGEFKNCLETVQSLKFQTEKDSYLARFESNPEANKHCMDSTCVREKGAETCTEKLFDKICEESQFSNKDNNSPEYKELKAGFSDSTDIGLANNMQCEEPSFDQRIASLNNIKPKTEIKTEKTFATKGSGKTIPEVTNEHQTNNKIFSHDNSDKVTNQIDRSVYSYKISNHTREPGGNFSSFKVNALPKYQVTQKRISFWYSVSEAKELLEKELIEYMFQLHRKASML